jgi:rhodanese-related sulfurtransferase
MAMDERGAMRPISQVDVRETQRRVTENGKDSEQADAILIDVREQWEYLQERAPGATLIPLSQFVQRYTEIPRDREVLLICHSGNRSQQAAMFLRRQGYERVGNVSGGMEAWEMAGLPVERGKA